MDPLPLSIPTPTPAPDGETSGASYGVHNKLMNSMFKYLHKTCSSIFELSKHVFLETALSPLGRKTWTTNWTLGTSYQPITANPNKQDSNKTFYIAFNEARLTLIQNMCASGNYKHDGWWLFAMLADERAPGMSNSTWMLFVMSLESETIKSNSEHTQHPHASLTYSITAMLRQVKVFTLSQKQTETHCRDKNTGDNCGNTWRAVVENW